MPRVDQQERVRILTCHFDTARRHHTTVSRLTYTGRVAIEYHWNWRKIYFLISEKKIILKDPKLTPSDL